MKNILIFLLTYLPLLYLQIIFLVLWWIIVFSSFRLLKFKPSKIIFLVIIEIILGMLIGFGYNFYSKKIALIKTENAILYAGPSEDYHKLKDIEQKKEVEIQQEIGDWFKIYYEDSSGWLKSDNLTLL
ncbi:MAG: SH3 domain-containing protein [Candidatus Babeliales bacterium]|nr:SH3 domain-containing protein [Candidatus Babeliales bacterium]